MVSRPGDHGRGHRDDRGDHGRGHREDRGRGSGPGGGQSRSHREQGAPRSRSRDRAERHEHTRSWGDRRDGGERRSNADTHRSSEDGRHGGRRGDKHRVPHLSRERESRGSGRGNDGGSRSGWGGGGGGSFGEPASHSHTEVHTPRKRPMILLREPLPLPPASDTNNVDKARASQTGGTPRSTASHASDPLGIEGTPPARKDSADHGRGKPASRGEVGLQRADKPIDKLEEIKQRFGQNQVGTDPGRGVRSEPIRRSGSESSGSSYSYDNEASEENDSNSPVKDPKKHAPVKTVNASPKQLASREPARSLLQQPEPSAETEQVLPKRRPRAPMDEHKSPVRDKQPLQSLQERLDKLRALPAEGRGTQQSSEAKGSVVEERSSRGRERSQGGERRSRTPEQRRKRSQRRDRSLSARDRLREGSGRRPRVEERAGGPRPLSDDYDEEKVVDIDEPIVEDTVRDHDSRGGRARVVRVESPAPDARARAPWRTKTNQRDDDRKSGSGGGRWERSHHWESGKERDTEERKWKAEDEQSHRWESEKAGQKEERDWEATDEGGEVWRSHEEDGTPGKYERGHDGKSRKGKSKGKGKGRPEVTIIVPSRSHIIGKGGANIRDIMERSGAIVHCARDTTKVQVWGDPAAVAEAEDLIRDYANMSPRRRRSEAHVSPRTGPSKAPSPSDGLKPIKGNGKGSSMERVIPVPSDLVGRLVGKDKATITKIRQESGAEIDLDRGEHLTKVIVSGTQHQIKHALEQIQEACNGRAHYSAKYTPYDEKEVWMARGYRKALGSSRIAQIAQDSGADLQFREEPDDEEYQSQLIISGDPQKVRIGWELVVQAAMAIEAPDLELEAEEAVADAQLALGDEGASSEVEEVDPPTNAQTEAEPDDIDRSAGNASHGEQVPQGNPGDGAAADPLLAAAADPLLAAATEGGLASSRAATEDTPMAPAKHSAADAADSSAAFEEKPQSAAPADAAGLAPAPEAFFNVQPPPAFPPATPPPAFLPLPPSATNSLGGPAEPPHGAYPQMPLPVGQVRPAMIGPPPIFGPISPGASPRAPFVVPPPPHMANMISPPPGNWQAVQTTDARSTSPGGFIEQAPP